jgi:hypothetical protein
VTISKPTNSSAARSASSAAQVPAATHLMHGLKICSEIPLDAPSIAPGKADLRVCLAERRPIPDAVPPGRLLARLEHPAGSSSLALASAGYTFRQHRLCDFEIDPDVRVLRAHLAPDADAELPALLVGGALATALALRGWCVLHASAVRVGKLVIAFVGSSGTGKTTVAALCCAAGARLVTDDVLRVESEHDQGWCFRGSSELRLRSAAAALAGAVPSLSRRSTIDGRLAVHPAGVRSSRLPLGAIVAPVPARGIRELRLKRLRGADALLELVRYPRTIGWRDAEKPRHDFDVLASLARTVPIFRMDVPWGPPFAADLGRRLLGEIAIHASEATAELS